LQIWFEEIFPVYRGLFSLVLGLWVWGGLLWAWGACRVNYLYMLGLDPRQTATALETFWEASTLTALLLASFVVHFKVVRCDFSSALIPIGAWPLVPFVAVAWSSVSPWRHRKTAWNAVANTLSAPWVEVRSLHASISAIIITF
jgi:hypothetical protein